MTSPFGVPFAMMRRLDAHAWRIVTDDAFARELLGNAIRRRGRYFRRVFA